MTCITTVNGRAGSEATNHGAGQLNLSKRMSVCNAQECKKYLIQHADVATHSVHRHTHKRAIRQADFNASPLAEHVWTEQHQVDWSNVIVVSNPRDYTTRLVEEALTIRSMTNVLNGDTGFLPSGYDGLC